MVAKDQPILCAVQPTASARVNRSYGVTIAYIETSDEPIHFPLPTANSTFCFQPKPVSLFSTISQFYPIELPLKTFGVSQPGSGAEVVSSGEGILAKGALLIVTGGVVGTTGGIVKTSAGPAVAAGPD